MQDNKLVGAPWGGSPLDISRVKLAWEEFGIKASSPLVLGISDENVTSTSLNLVMGLPKILPQVPASGRE